MKIIEKKVRKPLPPLKERILNTMKSMIEDSEGIFKSHGKNDTLEISIVFARNRIITLYTETLLLHRKEEIRPLAEAAAHKIWADAVMAAWN